MDCDAGHLYGYTSVDNDSKKGWKRCKCIIYACGTLAKKHKRVSTDETVEDRAQLVVAKYEAAGTWDINPAPPPPITTPITTKPLADGRD